MKKELMSFTHREVLGKIFTIYGDFENPMFLAKDIAEWIDYSYKDSRKIHRDVSKMLQSVDEDEKVKCTLNLGGEDCLHGAVRANTEMWFLTEDGLYEVLMQSRKPIAKAFKKEVKQILKTIRKQGAYFTTPKIEDLIDNPDALIDFLISMKE
ncbi:MAG: BRO family protein [Eubacteriales bacterium]